MITTIPKRNNDSNRWPITFETPIVNNKYIATEIKMLTLSITENKSNALRKSHLSTLLFPINKPKRITDKSKINSIIRSSSQNK